jgi:hypothetical protein
LIPAGTGLKRYSGKLKYDFDVDIEEDKTLDDIVELDE